MTAKAAIGVLALLLGLASSVAADTTHLPELVEAPWSTPAAGGQPLVHLYFFWSEHCPHCRRAVPFVRTLAGEYPWLAVRSHDLTAKPGDYALYQRLAALLGEQAVSVPAFFFCGRMEVGYDSAEHSGALLRQGLLDCRREILAGAVPIEAPPAGIQLPLVGRVDPRSHSLGALTLMIAALDAFNPCAFFVLLLLLSLLLRARGRARMLTVGLLFVLCSGLLYFVFMAAWLNLFLVFGEVRAITLAAGLLAVAMGVLGIKDYVLWGRGLSLSIPAAAKPRLYQRTRALLETARWPVLITGTLLLALAANSYELLCTAGFPMLYTRILTLHHLDPASYYLYLLFYNLVYVTPLLAIVAVFATTLGEHKLSERQGRLLKLLSGVMMLELGVVLVAAPGLLHRPATAAGLIGAALMVTALAALAGRRATLPPPGGGRA